MAGGALFLQVRAKQAAGGALLDAVRSIVDRAASAGALVVVNDRADVARLAGAQGVHVGQTDLAPRAVRAIVGLEAIVGLSTHTPEQYGRAVLEPIDYVAIGPAFGTTTKDTGHEAVGLDGIRSAASVAGRHDLPLVAIGGITLNRAPSVIEAGARAVAVISDLLVTGDPATRVRDYLRALK
jgi:thiamine-phosphate pyrophosphorylase